MPVAAEPRRIPPVVLLHQEGILALVALLGLALRPGGPFPWLAPEGTLLASVAVGAAAGGALSALLWLVRGARPLARLERWQRRLLRDWTATDAAAVALLSGLAEEALLRALVQPVVGLVPAAVLFSLLHVVPDRRLWAWPALAMVLGLALGGLYEVAGYPAAAAAHAALNWLALQRLRSGSRTAD